MHDICAVIPNWNHRDVLKACLEALQRQTFRNFEILIVDNASKDDSLSMVRGSFPFVRTIAMRRNVGFGRAVNIGIRHSETPYIFLLNNDTEAVPDCLERLMETIRREDECCGGVQCRMMNFSKRDLIDSLGIYYRRDEFYDIGHNQPYDSRYDKPGRILGVCAGGALYRRTLFQNVGFFDERFFAVYEDVDLSLRGLRAGWHFVYEPDAVVYHHKSLTINTMSYRKQLELKKNYFLLGLKNFPKRRLFRIVFQYMNMLQQDCFNVENHLWKQRVLATLKTHRDIWLGIPFSLKERRGFTVDDKMMEALITQSQDRPIW